MRRNPLQDKRLSEWSQQRRRTIQPLPAQLRAQVRITDDRTGRVAIEQSTASSMNAKRDLSDMRLRAEINAKYQYEHRKTGSTNFKQADYNELIKKIRTEIIGEEIVYLIGSNRTYKRENIGGKYFNIIRDKETGKQISKSAWSNSFD